MIDRGSTSARWTADRIRSMIASGAALPGEKMSEREITERLDISRNTLREAFSSLEAEGIIQRIPNRGVFVAQLDESGIREVYATRRLLEPAAVLWGDHGPVLGPMGEVLRRALAAREAGQIREMADANQEFHRLLVRSAGSETISATMERMLALMRLVFAEMRDHADFHAPYALKNRELLELLRAGRREEGAVFIRGYLGAAESELLDRFRAQQAA